MALTRRDLLKTTGLGLGAVLFYGCAPRPGEFHAQSPVELPEDLVTGIDNWYATLCRECPSSEGLIVRVVEGRAKKIEGNPYYPTNRGKTSAKCQANVQALYHPDRITSPMGRSGQRGSGQFQTISWDQAVDTIANVLNDRRSSPEKLAIVTEPLRGHLGMLVHRFQKAYGAQHLTFETLEETVLRGSIKRLLGQDQLPKFDIANAQYVLSFGSDFLGSWLSPVHYARQYGAFRDVNDHQRGTLVHVEPRLSLTAANADQWVPVKPGTEGILALSIAYVIITEELGVKTAIQALTGGNGASALNAFRPENVAGVTGVPRDRIEHLARDFANSQPSLAMGGGSAAAHTNGSFTMDAIMTLNFLVGNIGKPGGIIFNPPSPITDELLSGASRSSFVDWGQLTQRLRKGEVDAMIVRGANPVYGLPAAIDFAGALGDSTFVVSISSFMDETTAMADIILPEHAGLESWGDDIPDPGPGYQTIGFQQPIVNPTYSTVGFGDMLLVLADELDLRAELPWGSLKEMLEEGANKLMALGRGSIQATSPQAFWNEMLQRGGWWDEGASVSASVNIPSPPIVPKQPVTPKYSGDVETYPFHLVPFATVNLGDGRNAHLPWLQGTPDPLTTATWQTWVEVNPKTAKELGLREGEVVQVESQVGSVEALVYVHPATLPDIVSIPLGQGHQHYGQWAEGRGANPLDLVVPLTDGNTGALAWAATRVRLKKTGRRTRIPKLEGSEFSVQLPGMEVVPVVRDA